MPTRDDIIYDIQTFPAKEVARYIIDGVVEVRDIIEENGAEFSIAARAEVEKHLWEYALEANSVRVYNLYLKNYPEQEDGNHSDEARNLKDLLENPPKVVVPPVPKIPTPQPEPEPEPEPAQVIEEVAQEEEPADPWDLVDKTSVASLEEFRDTYPEHEMYFEAGRLISELERQVFKPKGPEWLKDTLDRHGASLHAPLIMEAFRNKQITKAELIQLIKKDNNFVNRKVIKQLLDNYILTPNDLRKAEVEEEFINVIMDNYIGLVNSKVDTSNMENPTAITFPSQEIYFWGMPASGKTCALGAILSSMSSGEVADSLNPVADCKGYRYLNQLKGTFQPYKISELPSGTNEDFVADMSFLLIDKKKKAHAITLIDIAGELLDTMRRIDEGDTANISENAMKGYQCMINLLVNNRSSNTKIHFFVVEYGGHDREHKGMKQADLLDAALTHIATKGVLKNSDAVYILMTKVDNALDEPGDFNKVLQDYLFTHYQGFYNRLKTMTRDNSIRNLGFIPFSIGEVCFKNLCRFDPMSANDIITTFIEDTRGENTGRKGKIFGFLRS